VSRTAARTLVITEALIRRYSRRGNYHSDADTAAELGLPGLVAQGTQVTGPAYGALLDEWGEDFLARGTLDVKFFGVTLAGDTVTAAVTIDGDDAAVEVRNDTRGAPAVVGDAHRRRGSS
jgi:acyl dehydratase